jgi:5-methylcytosine-specific restriction endonuclease McrA
MESKQTILQVSRVNCKMVNANTRSAPPWYRRQILREQGGRCANTKCSKTEPLDWKECETNHIIPWRKGGRTVRWNLEVLCISCHKNHTRSEAKKPRKKVKEEVDYSKPRLCFKR